MEKIIVTGDKKFADIDIFASAIAYSELMRLTNHESEPYIPGELNYSIPEVIIKTWKPKYITKYGLSPKVNTKFVIVDRTDPETFPEFIVPSSIIKIIDHHHDYTDYWRNILKENAVISDVGSCATLVWEEFKKKNLQEYISQTSARLLLTAIISNTSNFNSGVTTEADKKAFSELSRFAKLPKKWASVYFLACENAIMKDPKSAIVNDTKITRLPETEEKVTIGQIELWKSRDFIENNQDLIEKTLMGFGNKLWFMATPSIGENKNYLLCTSEMLKNLLTQAIGAKFNGDFGQTDKLWIRKEIMEALHSQVKTC